MEIKVTTVYRVEQCHLVRVVHSEDVTLQLFGVGARVTLLHHRVEGFPGDLTIGMFLEKILILSLV